MLLSWSLVRKGEKHVTAKQVRKTSKERLTSETERLTNETGRTPWPNVYDARGSALSLLFSCGGTILHRFESCFDDSADASIVAWLPRRLLAEDEKKREERGCVAGFC